MGKKLANTHVLIDATVSESPAGPYYSPALKRVMKIKNNENKPIFAGIYLSNKQLIALGKKLGELKQRNSAEGSGNGPEGMCFMVGLNSLETAHEAHAHEHNTVEMVPYRLKKNKENGAGIKFYEHEGVIGDLPKNEILISPTSQVNVKMYVDGNGFSFGFVDAMAHHVPQHTPPPTTDF